MIHLYLSIYESHIVDIYCLSCIVGSEAQTSQSTSAAHREAT